MGLLSQMLGNLTAAGKLDKLEIRFVDDVLHRLVATVDEVDVLGWHPAGSGEMQELLHDD